MTKREDDAATDKRVSYWSGEINRAKKRFQTFWDNGDVVVDTYRLQKADGNDALSKDKYNILYSSTETMRPNLYAQQPKARVALRNKDMASDTARMAAQLLEGCLTYLQQEEDFDEFMDAAVEDYMLPGLGQGWVRYEATFADKMNGDKPVMGTDGKTPEQELLDEMVKMEYVYWQDFLTGVSRTWKETPWVAKRIWLSKADATKRFGAEKANMLSYATRDTQARSMDNPSETAEAWEIWDKPTKTVYWYAEGLKVLLDEKSDPLKLKRFFPCPRPLRGISNTRTFVPRALYSQYKSQAETLNVMTKRIRLLSEALRVVGLFDGSQQKLADILNPASGNRMIAVDGWAQFAQNGGIVGSVQWVPIDDVVKTLNELLKAREVCKQEIYEITGFSDIVRGVSKASETLGAQNLKANWAGARVKKMQAEVQRFARDMIALAGELVAEHCNPETIAIFSGLPVPAPEDVKANPQLAEKVQQFMGACQFLHNETRRVSSIDIETDSTLLADEESEREDRTKFLASAGAFLQQAVPAMEATPELGPLLGAMLMFVVRTFPSSRPIEEEFEKVQGAMAARMQNQDQDKDGKKAAAQAAAQKTAQDGQLKMQELQVRQAHEQSTAANNSAAEQNRHAEKMAELQLRDREVALKERELLLKEGQLRIAEEDAHTRRYAAEAAAASASVANEQEMLQAQHDQALEYDRLAQEDQHHGDDLAAEADAADKDRQAATEAAQAQGDGGGETSA
jgi:hypothetical protein